MDFNPKDQLQKRFMRRITRADVDPPLHWIPHVAGFLRACVTGLGWGMCPERMVAAHVTNGELVEMAPGKPIQLRPNRRKEEIYGRRVRVAPTSQQCRNIARPLHPASRQSFPL